MLKFSIAEKFRMCRIPTQTYCIFLSMCVAMCMCSSNTYTYMLSLALDG